MPTFSGARYENPLKFINDLERFLEASHIQSHRFKLYLPQVISLAAYDWCEFIGESCVTFDEFKTAFLRRYWGRDAQPKVQQQLLTAVMKLKII